jgi:hypothetical protein
MTRTRQTASTEYSQPFLLGFRSTVHEDPLPETTYREDLALTLVKEREPHILASSRYLLATQTKTERRPESDDED